MAMALTHDKVARIREMYERARVDKDKFHEKWARYYAALWDERPMQVGRNTGRLGRPQANEIMPIITALVGWLGDARPKVNVSPAAYNPETPTYQIASDLAADMERVLEWVHRVNRFDLEREAVFFDGLTFGCGFYKAGWSEAFHGGRGDVTERRVDPWMIYPDPLARNTDTWRYVIERREMSRDEARERYGDIADLIGPGDPFGGTERPTQISKTDSYRPPMAIAGPIMGQGTVYASVTSDQPARAPYTYDAVTVLECWYLEDGRWRLTTIGGGEVLQDLDVAEELYEFGKPPYCRLPIHEIGEFWGPSLVSFLMSGQEALNDLLFHAHNNARLAGDPVLLEAIQAGTTPTRIVNRPGQRIPVQAPGLVEWMRPPEMPQIIVNLIQFWVQEMERISGLAGVVRGAAPSRRESEQAFTQMAEGSATRVRNVLRNLEWTEIELGEMVTSLVVEHYTEERIISLVGPEGQPTVTALAPRHFWVAPDPDSPAEPLRFTLWVEAGSGDPASRTAQIAEAQAMFGMGAIDREALLSHRRWKGWKQIVARIAEKEAAGAFQAPAARRRAR